ncbi:MAG TPA: hypothetical protein VI027_07415 [Rubrobacteraceae bacterium]
MGDDNDNPRLLIKDTDLERTLRYMEILEEVDLDKKVSNVLLMLGDCFPSGSTRDVRGASLKQVRYITMLAGFDIAQTKQFCRIIKEVGGMDSQQAHFLIAALK